MSKFWEYEKGGEVVKARLFNIYYERMGSLWQITNQPYGGVE